MINTYKTMPAKSNSFLRAIHSSDKKEQSFPALILKSDRVFHLLSEIVNKYEIQLL